MGLSFLSNCSIPDTMHLHPPERTHLYKVRFGVQVYRISEIERGKGKTFF